VISKIKIFKIKIFRFARICSRSAWINFQAGGEGGTCPTHTKRVPSRMDNLYDAIIFFEVILQILYLNYKKINILALTSISKN